MIQPLPLAPSSLARALRYSAIVLFLLLLLEAALLAVLDGVSQRQGSATLPSFEGLNPEQLLPQGEYAELVERALFSPDRKPKDPVQPSTTVTRGKASEHWLLVGVVKTSAQSYAMFSEKKGQGRLKLELGMSLDEWRIESISANQVTFNKDGEQDILNLLVSEPKKNSKRSIRQRGRSLTRSVSEMKNSRVPLKKAPAIAPNKMEQQSNSTGIRAK
ncbi:hypothetical protein A9Q89_04660 [Gammaproteobacteria bacterium 53_120_T64]|nr:hypothetical protein A9Q89_04660 [Gammaproteobacteria bacterium 53_120_T64]